MLAHAFIGARSSVARIAHVAVFYGFLTLFAGTVILLVAHDIAAPLGWDFFQGTFYLGYSLVLDLVGVAFVIGLLVFAVRRGIVRPPQLDYRRPDRVEDRSRYRIGDWFFLWALIALGIGGFVLEGIRIAMDDPGDDWANPVGWLFSLPLAGLSEETLAAARHGLWWSHGLLAIMWVAAIPYTKASHMGISYLSIVLRDPEAKRRLQPVPEQRAMESTGYKSFADFELKHLIDLDACTKCGLCHTACPANAVGMPLSPRDVILELREQAHATVGARPLFGERTPDVGVLIGPDGLRPEALWSCMQCNACVEVCPVGIEQGPIINQFRRALVEEGEMEPALQSTLMGIHKSGNSFGANRRTRGAWAKALPFEIPDARKQPVDVLWFVGDFASFDARNQRVTRMLAELLHAAEVDFGILYDGERNAGNDVRRVGEEGLFELLATENIRTLESCTFNRIFTSDPHSLNTLRNEYPDLGASYDVVHHTTLLLELVQAGRLRPAVSLGRRVTYHDPCYLGRINGGFDAPRALLGAIGCELAEMPRNRESSFCCGAGGGRIWMTETYGARERPSENRIREALGLEGVDTFVVSCPKDVTMYEDAVKTTGNVGAIVVCEIVELLSEACSLRT